MPEESSDLQDLARRVRSLRRQNVFLWLALAVVAATSIGLGAVACALASREVAVAAAPVAPKAAPEPEFNFDGIFDPVAQFKREMTSFIERVEEVQAGRKDLRDEIQSNSRRINELFEIVNKMRESGRGF